MRLDGDAAAAPVGPNCRPCLCWNAANLLFSTKLAADPPTGGDACLARLPFAASLILMEDQGASKRRLSKQRSTNLIPFRGLFSLSSVIIREI